MAIPKLNEILTSLPSEELDQLVSFACEIFETPVAFISIIEETHLKFKTRIGFDSSSCTKENSFCGYAVRQQGVFEVEDALDDERFKNNPMVLNGPQLRFYAGAPIFDLDSNEAIGAICIMDKKVRKLSPAQKKLLIQLAGQISKILHFKILTDTLQQKNFALKNYETAIQNMHEGLVIQNQEGIIVDCNAATLKIFGVQPENIIGKTSYDPIWHPIKPSGEAFAADEHPSMITLKTGQSVRNVIMGVRAPNHDHRWIVINSSPVFDEHKKNVLYAITTFADVTEMHDAQLKIVEDARINSLYHMTAGLAHQINNPLAIITGSCAMISRLSQNLDNFDLGKQHLEKIKSAVFRISEISNSLRIFSKKSYEANGESILIEKIFEDILVLSKPYLEKMNIKLELDIPADSMVFCNPNKVRQVIFNLLDNSQDSMKNLSEKWIKIKAECEKDFVEIRVTDSGSGIPTNIADSMFVPFYTTKRTGPGLGLSSSKSLIQSMGGDLVYDSQSKNASFIIYLPKTEATLRKPS